MPRRLSPPRTGNAVGRAAEPECPPDANPDILRALSTLPEPLRLCLTLHYSEGYAINEIARMLRVPAGTVKSRLSRARAALRAQLHDE